MCCECLQVLVGVLFPWLETEWPLANRFAPITQAVRCITFNPNLKPLSHTDQNPCKACWKAKWTAHLWPLCCCSCIIYLYPISENHSATSMTSPLKTKLISQSNCRHCMYVYRVNNTKCYWMKPCVTLFHILCWCMSSKLAIHEVPTDFFTQV